MQRLFDPYHKWLGIPPDEQPPSYYRLLGIQPFESDLDVIESAADQRMAHLRGYQSGQRANLSQQILNEVAAARVCLLNPSKRAAYDEQLRQTMSTESPASPPTLLPMPSSLPFVPDAPFATIDETLSPRIARLRAAQRKRQSNPTGLILGITVALISVFLALVAWKIASSGPPKPATPPSVKSNVPREKLDNKPTLPPRPPQPVRR